MCLNTKYHNFNALWERVWKESRGHRHRLAPEGFPAWVLMGFQTKAEMTSDLTRLTSYYYFYSSEGKFS